jgi:hypothetical protein
MIELVTTRGTRYLLADDGNVIGRSDGAKGTRYENWTILGAATRHNASTWVPLADIVYGAWFGQGWIVDRDNDQLRQWGGERLKSAARIGPERELALRRVYGCERALWLAHLPMRLWPERLELPLRRRKPTRYFVNSMSDLFHKSVSDAFIAAEASPTARSHQTNSRLRRPGRGHGFAGHAAPRHPLSATRRRHSNHDSASAGPKTTGGPVTEVHVRPVEYLVTVWPEGHDCHEASLWSLLVTYRGNGRWAVEQGWSHGSPKIVLTRSGKWDLDQRGDPHYRFTLEEALDQARQHAATVTIAGRTAAEAMREHLARGCDG